LLLIVALAHAIVMLHGMLAEQQGLHRRYQANSTRTRRVLSWFALGRLVLHDYLMHAVLDAVARRV